jgi:hypothetical protein
MCIKYWCLVSYATVRLASCFVTGDTDAARSLNTSYTRALCAIGLQIIKININYISEHEKNIILRNSFIDAML